MFPMPMLLPLVELETVSLQGSSGSPIVREQTSLDPDDAVISLLVGCTTSALNSIDRGYIQYAGYDSGDLATFTNIAAWVNPLDFQDGPYYVRATLDSGTAPNLAGTLNTWLALTNGGSNQFWSWRRTSAGSITGTLKLEIATDSGGSNIVATGYYQFTAAVDF